MNDDAHANLEKALAAPGGPACEWRQELLDALLDAAEEVRRIDRVWDDEREAKAIDAADALAEVGALCTADLPDLRDDQRGATPGRQSDAEELPGDPIPGLRRSLLKSLRSLHAGDPAEWRATTLPVLTLAGHATHAIAALSGEKDGIAAMFDAADNGRIEDAMEALVGLWQITSTLAVQGE